VKVACQIHGEFISSVILLSSELSHTYQKAINSKLGIDGEKLSYKVTPSMEREL